MSYFSKEPQPGEAPEGVSVWDHVERGAVTGFAAGGLATLGAGFIPGAIGGAALGLGNGLWELYKEHEDRATWERTMGPELRAFDDDAAQKARLAPSAAKERAIWDQEDAGKERMFQVNRQLQQKNAGGDSPSIWDRLF